MNRRVFVMGLDSVPPELLFGELLEHLPNIRRMIEQGLSGPLRSCHPPITVPAWQVLATSKDPGRLGLYGFRHRKGFAYTDGWTASSQALREPAIWDVIARVGKRSCLVGVPPAYPPKPVHDWSVSCFLTPSAADEYTWPPALKNEVEQLVGTYLFDVQFRVEERDRLLKELYEMTQRRFKIIRHLAATKPWDFFMFVEIGFDRLHHAFWKFFDKQHPKHQPGNQYEGVAKDYYSTVDAEIGELLRLLDDAIVIVASDHGSKGMKGAFCVNDWLVQQGYLTLRQPPDTAVELEQADIDWSRTKAWGWGGYYARIFLNVKGREPQGVIEPADYERVRVELAEALRAVRDPSGAAMQTHVFFPEELYTTCLGDKPDLMVYFDDLCWRSAGTIGHDTLYLSENDTGPDDSVHSMDGIFILYDPQRHWGQRVEGLSLLDVAPTVLDLMGVPVPADMQGRSLAPRLAV